MWAGQESRIPGFPALERRWMTEGMEVHDTNTLHSVGSRRMNCPPLKSSGEWEHSWSQNPLHMVKRQEL